MRGEKRGLDIHGPRPHQKWPPVGVEKDDSNRTPGREAAAYAISRAKSFEDLNAPTEEEGSEKFKELVRDKLFNWFVVQGIKTWIDVVGPNGKTTKRRRLVLWGDLDGKISLGILEKAGVLNKKKHRIFHGIYGSQATARVEGAPSNADPKKEIRKTVAYVDAGKKIEGAINTDTGGGRGVEFAAPTLLVDHHGEGVGRETSSSESWLKIVESWKLVDNEQKKVLERVAEFINDHDNGTNPKQFSTYADSHHTLAGLANFAEFDAIYDFFAAGMDPYQKLTDAEITKFHLGKKDAVKRRREAIQRAFARLEELESKGFVVESKTYGKVVIEAKDFGNKQKSMNYEAAGNRGINIYLMWNPDDEDPENRGFFVSSNKDNLPTPFVSKELTKRIVHGHILPFYGEIKTPLSKILEALGVDLSNVSVDLRKFLEQDSFKRQKIV